MSSEFRIKKIDFLAPIEVIGANPNGDPSAGGRPRVFGDLGMITDVSLKHKVREWLARRGYPILCVSNSSATDGMTSIQQRCEAAAKEADAAGIDPIKYLCSKYLDVRLFGALGAYKQGQKAPSKKKRGKKTEDQPADEMAVPNPEAESEGGDGVSFGVPGAITIQMAFSVLPVDVVETQITKCVNGRDSEESMTSDRMGWKYAVRHGVYILKGAVNPINAAKNGLSEEDIEIFREALLHMFEGDESAARPAGSMSIRQLYWWTHKEALGSAPSFALYDTVSISPKVERPTSWKEYDVAVDTELLSKSGIALDIYTPLVGWEKKA